MMRIIKIGSLFGLLMLYIATTAQQIKGIRATVDPMPNYSLTKNQSNVATLTDGQFVTGNMYWKDPGTLGWQNVNRVTIDLTLPSGSSVGTIKLNTVTGQKAQVNLPLCILVFASNDQKSWQYIGDMMKQKHEDSYYQITSITQQVDRQAQFLKLVVIPNGSYFFTDEIEVFAAKGNVKALAPAIHSENIDSLIKSQRTTSIDQRFAARSAVATTGAAIGPLVVQRLVSSWASPDQLAQKQEPIHTIVGLTTYTTVVVTNNSGSPQQLPISFSNAGIASLYWAKPVKSRDFKVVPDALMPIADGSTLNVQPNETQVLLLRIKPVKSGNASLQLKVGAVQQTIDITVASTNFNSFTQTPDVNVWAYFNDPLLKERPVAAHNDLLDHGVNTFVFHPGILLPEKPVSSNEALQKMLPMVKGFKQVLLFLNITAKDQSYWTETRKQTFANWYKDLQAALQQQGISPSNIYLYPIDEVKPSQIAAFKSFVTYAKSQIPGARFFATISDIKSLPEIQPLVDIAQVYNTNQLIAAAKQAQTSSQSIWLYDTKKPTKSLPPYGYYRLMAWRAFANGLTGIGFWQYADAGHEQGATSLWDDFDGKSADYNVVYDDNANVNSSRRWEAFKQGIDDYRLLMAYAQKYGRNAALKICNEVLDNAGNPFIGDQARKNIISGLEK
ncbi:hypothetical protein DVR12_15370 [Chitinophaga silvatica]|uniref:Glycoside hydrolase 123 catalytic domain-containing protein n=1 Tax=Chitinophaga silvatica TaxID=2282649 RepID=A0A3E1Y9I4_9BACT|nr:glycoside hydrolase domain-containing protein [Chitinophaga silvatica]RFS22021.1 hypothetical protein DVR12_15370 [Chitinophaga silvatica]